MQWANRITMRQRGVGGVGLQQRVVRRQRHDGVDHRVDTLDPSQMGGHDLSTRHTPTSDQIDEGAGGTLAEIGSVRLGG